ncbi:MAG: hypothetical protein RIQ89_1966 [Bacteroidota bacterium]|jgi:cyclopropane fatty-acyl-phospholipid synthase-like methyltransferase
MIAVNAWYSKWFDTPYYHMLYSKRDDQEARKFLDNILPELNLAINDRVLDMGCGKGRHSIYLNEKGFDVTAFDLSISNIKYCKQFENSALHFYIHDLRNTFAINYFHAAFNVFSSFGYFESDRENFKVITHAAKAIKPGGYFVFDFINASSLRQENCYQEIELNKVKFKISKQINGSTLLKNIEINDGGKIFNYEERVKTYLLNDFESVFNKNDLSIKKVFGNYNLQPFDHATSERILLIARKNDE